MPHAHKKETASTYDNQNKINTFWKNTLVSLVLIFATLIVFWQIQTHEFIIYDDDDYLTKNPYVLLGLTVESLKYAFTSTFHGHWHPLTWISHCVDIELFGLAAGRHHFMSLMLHVLTTLLLFFTLQRITGSLYKSAFVAMLFGLHPLHVETVAWIAGRKDLLCGLFWILTIRFYARYVENPGAARYVTVLICFVLGIMAKSIMVMLPLVLLCLDYWPLNRFSVPPEKTSDPGPGKQFIWLSRRKHIYRLIAEKIPFLLLLVAPAVFALLTVQGAKTLTLNPLRFIPRIAHLSDAAVFYCNYIVKLFYPLNLTIPTPALHFPLLSPWRLGISLILLAGISTVVIWWRRKYPFLVTGWLWYLIVLFPLSGMIAINVNKIADRYSYISLTGLFIMVTWGVSEICKNLPRGRQVLSILSVLVIVLLVGLSWKQTAYWKNNVTLFRHTVDVYPDDYRSRNRIGVGLIRQKKYKDAVTEFNNILKIKPLNIMAHHNKGMALVLQSRFTEAEEAFRRVLAINPDYWVTHYHLALLFMEQGNNDAAISHLKKAIKIRPFKTEMHRKLSQLLIKQNRIKEAVAHIDLFAEKMLAKHKHKKAAVFRLFATKLKEAEEFDQAIAYYQKALTLEPDHGGNHLSMGILLAQKEEYEEAVFHYQTAIEISPDNADAHYNLAVSLVRQGNMQSAVRHLEKAIEILPNFAQAHNNLGTLLARQGQFQEAQEHFNKAVRINPDYIDARENMKKISGLIGKSAGTP